MEVVISQVKRDSICKPVWPVWPNLSHAIGHLHG